MTETNTQGANLSDVVNNATAIFTTKEQFQMTAYGSLYGMALLCIMYGSIRSLRFVQKHIRKKRLIETSITMNEAKKFPITASCVLFGLYIFFKCDDECRQNVLAFLSTHLPAKVIAKVDTFLAPLQVTNMTMAVEDSTKTVLQKTVSILPVLNKDNAKTLLMAVLCWEGSAALAFILKPIFSRIFRRLPIGDWQPRRNYSYLWSIKRSKDEMEEGDIESATDDEYDYMLKIEWDSHDLAAVICCLFVGAFHFIRRHWLTNNILGVAFSIYGIENIHLCSFKAGSMLLAGLFIYDVFWVFATDVMTTVAKGIEAPVLLQFPQDIYRVGWINASKHAMLGLGDIVIPGIFIALLRRFDYRVGNNGTTEKKRYYFLATTVAYTVGLSITMGVMHAYKAAQPALLYLVPACVLVPVAIASMRGELHELINYREEHLIEKKDDEEEESEEEESKDEDKKEK